MSTDVSFIRWFSESGIDDVSSVGGKNASLGELYRELAGAGVRVPHGFAVTADGYRRFRLVLAIPPQPSPAFRLNLEKTSVVSSPIACQSWGKPLVC